MASYTTQVRTICEMYSTKKRSGYADIPDVIFEACPKVFDFTYPIFDESYRRVLETKILMHYYTREICEETVGLWKLRLMARLNEIMPYYNQLYESELLKFNPFFDVDYTTTHKGRANERKARVRQVDTENNTDFAEEIDSDYTLDTDEKIIDNTTENEKTVTNTVKVEDIDYHSVKTENEVTEVTTDTTDDYTENVKSVEDKELNKDVTLHDKEHTDTVEHEESNTVAHKVGNNDTHLTDKGQDVDTTVIDETEVRTPNLTNDKQENKTFDDLGTGADNRNIQKSEYTSTFDKNDGTEHLKTEEDKKGESLDLYSDTPQGNLNYVDGGNGQEIGVDPTTGERQGLKTKMFVGWLTNGRDIETAEHTEGVSDRETHATANGYKDFDETTDDDVYHTRNYQQITDDHTVTKDTGNETKKKDGLDTITHDIDETHHTHYDIDETTTTDFVDDKTGTKDFEKDQTENTKQTEHNTVNTDKVSKDVVHTDQNTERNETDEQTDHTDDDTTTDFTGNVDDVTDYTRDKTIGNVYVANKDTANNRKFLENVTDDMKHTVRNMDEYVNRTAGKISDLTYSKMLLEFRTTFLNIDMMIIDELSDLFFGLFV